jgi:uncharacterized membrane protein YdjX (TVP38/TMEM64 family)
MAFGSARAQFWRFLAGLVLGVAPKTAVVAFGAKAVIAAISGNVAIAVLAAGGGLVIAGLGALVSRQFLRGEGSAFSRAQAAPAFTSRMAGSAE